MSPPAYGHGTEIAGRRILRHQRWTSLELATAIFPDASRSAGAALAAAATF
jgi:hypothetical protein